jgi:hypothetical protein
MKGSVCRRTSTLIPDCTVFSIVNMGICYNVLFSSWEHQDHLGIRSLILMSKCVSHFRYINPKEVGNTRRSSYLTRETKKLFQKED